jgi:hypothetical protein
VGLRDGLTGAPGTLPVGYGGHSQGRAMGMLGHWSPLAVDLPVDAFVVLEQQEGADQSQRVRSAR